MSNFGPQRSGNLATQILTVSTGILLLISIVLQVIRLSTISFTNTDDIFMDLAAAMIKNRGVGAYFEHAGNLARDQGRFYFHFSFFFFVLPYFFQSLITRALVIVLFHLLSVFSIAWFLSRFLHRRYLFCAVAIFYALLPHWWAFFPVGAYPIVYSFGLTLYFSGLAIYLKSFEPGIALASTLYRIGGCLLFFLSFFIYEALHLPFLIIAATVSIITVVIPGQSWRQSMTKSVIRFLPLLLVFIAQLTLYVVYRRLHPPHYSGTQATFASVTDYKEILHVCGTFLSGALPASNFILQPDFIAGFSIGSPRLVGYVKFVADNLTFLIAAQASLSAVLIAAGACTLRKNYFSPTASPWSLRLIFAGVLSVAAAVLVPLPLGVSVKYQHTVLYPPYIPGYYSFVFLYVGFAFFGVAVLRRFARASVAFFSLITGTIAFSLFVFITLTGVANQAVVRSQRDFSLIWQEARRIALSDEFRKLSPDAAILAPSLWDGLDKGWGRYTTYWADYFRETTHVSRPILRTLENWSAAQQSLYYLEIQRLPNDSGACAILSKISTPSSDLNSLSTDEVFISAAIDLKYCDLSFLSVTGNDRTISQSNLSFGPLGTQQASPLPPFSYLDGVYSARVSTPGAVVGSHQIVRHRTEITRPRVSVDFADGFSGLEQNERKYWRWSNGTAGAGTMIFHNNSLSPISLEFQAVVRTGASGTTLFQLEVDGNSSAQQFSDGDLINRKFLALPGDTRFQIRSSGKRIGLGEDGRYIVFGLENWTLNATEKETKDAAHSEYKGLVSIEFGSGFYNAESADQRYWRWSTSPEGTASEFFLSNDSSAPIEVIFDADVSTVADSDYPCSIRFGQVLEECRLSRQPSHVRRRFALAPGRTRVEMSSPAPAQKSAGDPRTFRFALSNWHVTYIAADTR